MTRTGEEALAWCRADKWVAARSAGWCLKQVRNAFGVGAHDFTPGNGRDPLAVEAYMYANHKHSGMPPKGAIVPVFWSGGSSGAGHIAVSEADGVHCWSTDINSSGHWGRCKITDIHSRWGLAYLGWTEDLNTVRVYSPASAEKPRPAQQATAPKGYREVCADCNQKALNNLATYAKTHKKINLDNAVQANQKALNNMATFRTRNPGNHGPFVQAQPHLREMKAALAAHDIPAAQKAGRAARDLFAKIK